MKKFEVLIKGYKFPSILVTAKTKTEAIKAAKNVMLVENFPRAVVGEAKELKR